MLFFQSLHTLFVHSFQELMQLLLYKENKYTERRYEWKYNTRVFNFEIFLNDNDDSTVCPVMFWL